MVIDSSPKIKDEKYQKSGQWWQEGAERSKMAVKQQNFVSI